MKFSKTMFVALVAALALAAIPSQAQDWGRHPAYLHALSDLRLMRAYLDRLTPNEVVDAESAQAINEIDEAIRAIKEASIDDHKDLRDHAPIDVRITPANRFRQAREAGNAAIADLNREEDNGWANGLKRRAIDHVERANHTVDHILERFAGGPGYGQAPYGGQPYGGQPYGERPYGERGDHPAYLRALSDLRLMRAYIERPSPDPRINADMQDALNAIDAAMQMIRQASIDDHKDLRDHAPIDAHITPANRFRQAREAGDAAWHDIDKEEDNGWADGLKHRAMDRIEHANHVLDHIMERIGRMN